MSITQTVQSTAQLPPLVPRIRTLTNATRFLQNPTIPLAQYIQEYGETFAFYVGGVKYGILSIDPEVNQHVLQKNNKNYHKSHIQKDFLGRFTGPGLLVTDGDYWLKQRRLIQPGFHRAKLAALTEIMQKVVDDSCDQIELQEGQEVEMSHLLLEFAFKIIAKSLFSRDYSDKLMDEVDDNVTEIQRYVIRLIRQPYLHWWFRMSGKEKNYNDISEETRNILLKIIHERKKSSETYDDLLDMLLSSKYEDTGEGMSDKQLLDETLILFAAGHETTANSLSWTSYLLAKHPKVVEKMRAELSEKIGDRKPSFTDLRELTYLTQVIKESMRLYPPAWITDRVALEDDEVKGYKIPKGTIVNCYIYGAHHSEKYWKNPEAFIPERFEKENMKGKPNFAYFPFGGGPRLCIGNNFAMMEMQLVLAEMVRRFDFELVPDQQIELQPLITLRPKNGVLMKLYRR